MRTIFSFKKIDNTDVKFIDWFGVKLIEKSTIIPIQNSIIADDLDELLHKNSVQGKIWIRQRDKIVNAIRNITDNSCECTKQDLQRINNICNANDKTIKKYSDLNLSALLQKYRDTHSANTSEEIAYMKNLLVVSALQEVIINVQMIKLLTVGEQNLYKILTDKCNRTIDDSNLDTVTDEKMLDIVFSIENLQMQRDDIYISHYDLSIPVFFFNVKDFNRKEQKKIIPPKTVVSKNITNDCCICFDKIDQKIVLIPCGHTTICENCIGDINKCPICMSQFTQYVKIFI